LIGGIARCRLKVPDSLLFASANKYRIEFICKYNKIALAAALMTLHGSCRGAR
jgi:hypothetical protein